MNRIKMYDLEIFAASKEELLKEIEERLKVKEKITIMSINPEILLGTTQNAKVKEVMLDSKINIPDGNGAILLARKKGLKIEERITGFDIFKDLCHLAVVKGESVFLYGAEDWVVKKTAEELKKEYPGLKIAGFENGFEKPSEEIVKKINETEADFLFIALGSPRQEEFIRNHLKELGVKIIQPVGGSFDVIAKKTKRAPVFVQRIKLEWAYRLLKDLKRTKRIISMVGFLVRELSKRGKSG